MQCLTLYTIGDDNIKDNICEYARLGLVHHLLYEKELNVSKNHLETFINIIKRKEVETVDCCLPYGEEERKLFKTVLAQYPKEVVYAMHLIPASKLSPSSVDPFEQSLVRFVMEDQIRAACMVGATSFIFVSGLDLPKNREAARSAFKDFCIWFCRELEKYNMWGLLEPFDRTFDKKYLYGPIEECVELLDSLQPYISNLGIELDIAHLPLMGEKINEAIYRVKGYLKRVHIGNCVLKDSGNIFYGDKHPPVGINGGEIDIEEIALTLSVLLKIGYISKSSRGVLVMEMRPYPGMTVEETIKYSFDKLEKAWSIV